MSKSDYTGVPTPNEWLASTLDDLQLSISALARIIGRSRTEVQRWVSRREQIPRHHLAEIAAQLGTPGDLERAIKLKECEDFADNLRRRLGDLARVSKCDPGEIESATFALLNKKTGEGSPPDSDEYASVLLYNMTHAAFVFRQWSNAAQNRDFSDILSPQSMKLHIRYPANHFLGLALSLGSLGGLLAEFQDLGLEYLRRLASVKEPDGSHHLPSQHAVHMLARFGTATDQSLVGEVVESATQSDDPLSVRLGYAGLIQRSENQNLAEKYTWMLQHNETLAFVDLLFEAVHYGDAMLDSNRSMPNKVDHFEKSLASIVRRLEQPNQSEVMRNLELFRLLGLMDRVGPIPFQDFRLAPRLLAALDRETPGEASSPQIQVARKRLIALSDINGSPTQDSTFMRGVLE